MTLHTVGDSFDRALFEGASCAIGVFDGLHVGHRYLIGQAAETKRAGGRAVVITFDIDPDEVFRPARVKKLMRNADRLSALTATQADDVVVLPFTRDLYSRTPGDFLSFLFDGNAPSHIHVGEDFKFGAMAAGDLADLKSWGKGVGCHAIGHALLSDDGQPITATRIRKLLQTCDPGTAARLLGRPYRMTGTVLRGRGEGSGFGFATANLNLDPPFRVIGDGVYAAYAHIGNERFKAAVSVGVSPTFEEASTANLEAHVLDFEDDLVGREVSLDFMEFLRPMMKFGSTDELIATVMGNIDWVRENL